MNRETKLRGALDFLFLLVAVGGFAINLFLLSHGLANAVSGIAGCGGEGCDELLASRWALIFGIPVTAFGVSIWFALIASSTEHFRWIHHLMLSCIAGAAVWFIFVQAVILRSFCPWCVAAHVLGIIAVVSGTIRLFPIYGVTAAVKKVVVWSVVAFLGIGLAQVYGPIPATYRIDELSAVSSPNSLEDDYGRIAFFDDGSKSYQVSDLPRLGREDATHILVEYFDYQCAACQKMASYMDALVAKYPADVAVLLLPVPLEQSCNPYVAEVGQRPGSCETARIALAVWRVHPDEFEGFHRALLADPSLESARRLALGIMAPERLESARTDSWVEERIRNNVLDWHALSKTTRKLPKLLIGDRRILHGLPTGETDFIRVMEQELGL